VAIFAQVIAIHVGRPRSFKAEDDSGKPWISGMVKSPVSGSVYVNRLNVAGDDHLLDEQFAACPALPSY
jgi:hypothetical protein